MKDIVVAAACMECKPRELRRNLDLTYEMSLKAKAEGASIVCFPEASLTGYLLEGIEGLYEEMPQEELVAQLKMIAEETGLCLLAGLVDVLSGPRPMISHCVAVPGRDALFHRKTHLSVQEKKTYQPGDEIRIFEEAGVAFGIQLCYEGHFPELSSVMALMGAELIFFPHASPRGLPMEKTASWLRHLSARAFDNGLFVVACNQAGEMRKGVPFPAVAMILGPDGRKIAAFEGGGNYILKAGLNSELLKRTRENDMAFFLKARRPELYAKLLSKGPFSAGPS
jgi:N-carbamoylputrescine amidase